MFDGVPVEHFHRSFISTVPSSRPISTSTNLTTFLSANFDPLLFPSPHPPHPGTLHQTPLFQPNHFHEHPAWSNDEVVQLLRIKSASASDNWFKDFTNWDHVSSKLAEMGYKRSSEKCKEKFEEETCRSFSTSIDIECNKTTTSSSTYLISHDEFPDNIVKYVQQPQPQLQLQLEEKGISGEVNLEDFEKDPQPTDHQQVTKSNKRKRKHKKFKMVKGLCVDLVNKMMAQQEEMHKKLLQDMADRDQENIKREEAWRKEEVERVQMEIHLREHEQEMARDRQSTITDFLNKITSFDHKNIQIPFNINLQDLQAIATNIEMTKTPSNQDQPMMVGKDDTGRRWPRDEVLALISIRSNVNNNGLGEEHYEGGGKGSLWERISQGMLELGYKRSAKRCKEKWENINKYFRKTKDGNKKRSLESRTCPYYHELSKLYNQASLSNPITEPSSQDQLLTTEN